MSQLHFFNPTQGDLDLELPKRGNPSFKNKSVYGATKPVRTPIALLSEVQSFIKSKELDQASLAIEQPDKDVCLLIGLWTRLKLKKDRN